MTVIYLTTVRVPLLSVVCDLRYPGIVHEIGRAMTACGARTVGYRERTGCILVSSQWMHWPCLIPQHGVGRKHHRPITLRPWQQRVVDVCAGPFVRGLFHSDGCRTENRVAVKGRNYCYPRYMFSNESADIMQLCQRSLDRLGVRWRMCRRNLLSVARRDDVALLDHEVGPKW